MIVHGTHLNQEDLGKIKDLNLPIVACPRSNAYFGVGIPPIDDIIEREILLALGTDNIMANAPDMFEEMRYLYFTARNMKKALPAREVLKMATTNAAKAFNMNDKVGSISEGKQANFFLVDLNAPNYFTNVLLQEQLYPLILMRTKPQNIKKTYIRGELAFERN